MAPFCTQMNNNSIYALQHTYTSQSDSFQNFQAMENSLFSSHLLILKTTKLLLILFSLVIIRSSNSQQPEVEALLQLKQHFNDPQNHLINWKTSPSPCHFSGITCNSTSGLVTSLALPNMKLSGQLSPSIATLQSLTVLNLGENSISGPLPPELMNCISLQLLNLSSNSFNGHLPDFSSLKNLQVLDLSSNAFSGGFPPWLGNLTALVSLGLASNKFDESDIPENIGKLKNLKVLFLAQCNLVKQIPASIFELTELETLDLSQNQLSGDFPISISNLLNLRKVELYQNKLTGSIPSQLANLIQLREFDVSQNQMAGKLPAELADMKNLTVFQLFRNNFSGELPPGFGDFQHLIGLSLYENSFSGEVPKNLGRYSPLISIGISENYFSGRFPQFLCESNKLQYLLALQNNFSGEFPGNYATCKSLVRFRISQNGFEGMIPNSLWGLPFAAIIDVADNGFTGDIHADVGISTSLTQLYVNNNKLSGELPMEIGMLSQLQKLYASNNSFSGRIPRQIGNLSSLISLHLELNEFSGPIPSELGYCTKLTEINIARNLLNGGIPATFSLLNSLNSLNLSRNFLTGTIPESLQTLKLTSIDFLDNKLSGRVPPGLLIIAGEEAFSGNPELCFSETSVSCNASHRHKSKMPKSLMLLLIMLAVMVLFLAILFRTYKCFMFESRIEARDQEKSTEKDQVWKMESFNPKGIDIEEICCLDGKNLIGSGRTGEVYRVELKNKGTVAVKQLHNGTQISAPELDMLKNIKHKNILKLYACSTKGGSNFLIFEYMPRGNLHQAIRRKIKGGQPELDWTRRYKIAVGAAKAIMHLHHDCSPAILHKNIKSSNIYLDDQYEAKIVVKLELSDFSGTNSYMAPELAYSIKGSEKSDVYSFGVVLLELITGYSPIEPIFGEGKDIVYWVSTQINSENVAEILDSSLSENAIEDMIKVLKVAMLCTMKLPAVRPSMTSVVRMLIDAEPCFK